MTDEVRDMIRKALTDEPPIGLDYDTVHTAGRRRLARRHVVVTAGAALGVVAVVGAIVTAGQLTAGPARSNEPAGQTTISTTPPAAGCAAPARVGPTPTTITAPPDSGARDAKLAESARLTETFARFTIPVPPGVTADPAHPRLCVDQDGWSAEVTLRGPAGNRTAILQVQPRAGQAPGECARFGGQVQCQQRVLPDRTAIRISVTPPLTPREPTLVDVAAWRPDNTIVRLLETGTEGSAPPPRYLTEQAMIAIVTAPELKLDWSPPANERKPAEPSDRRAAELTAALAKEFSLPSGMRAQKVPHAQVDALAFFVSQGGYKLNADLVDAAGQGNLFIDLSPPDAAATVECLPQEPNCHVITLPDGRKATLSQTDDGVATISLGTIAADGTRVFMWSRNQSARAEGSSGRTRPQPPLSADDLIRIASVAGLRW